MGHYTHISISFSADKKDACYAKPFAKNAKNIEAKHMLQAFESGEGFFCGPKGALFNWGYVGNYTNVKDFINEIVPFLECLRSNDTHFLDFDHALVFYEAEGKESCDCYEIKPRDDDYRLGLVVVEHKELPFCWNQY